MRLCEHEQACPDEPEWGFWLCVGETALAELADSYHFRWNWKLGVMWRNSPTWIVYSTVWSLKINTQSKKNKTEKGSHKIASMPIVTRTFCFSSVTRAIAHFCHCSPCVPSLSPLLCCRVCWRASWVQQWQGQCTVCCLASPSPSSAALVLSLSSRGFSSTSASQCTNHLKTCFRVKEFKRDLVIIWWEQCTRSNIMFGYKICLGHNVKSSRQKSQGATVLSWDVCFQSSILLRIVSVMLCRKGTSLPSRRPDFLLESIIAFLFTYAVSVFTRKKYQRKSIQIILMIKINNMNLQLEIGYIVFRWCICICFSGTNCPSIYLQ